MKKSELKQIIKEEIGKTLNEGNNFDAFIDDVKNELLLLAKHDKNSQSPSYLNQWFKSEEFKDLVRTEFFNRKTYKQASKSIYSIFR